MDAFLQEVLAGKRFLLLDGAMGTMIQRRGLANPSQPADLLNISNPAAIRDIHAAYVESGSQAVLTNTFSTNRLNLAQDASVAEIMRAGVACARDAGAQYVGADVSALGELLEPYGDLEEDEAFEIFQEVAHAAREALADFVMIETMTDLNEAQIAIRATKSACDLPIFASMSFGAGGATFMGVTPEQAAVGLVEAGADVVGMNCSLGPDDMVDLVRRMRQVVSCPIIAQPNAGVPHFEDGATVFDVTPEAFVSAMERIIDAGATVLGGCCGTDPQFIAGLKDLIASREI